MKLHKWVVKLVRINLDKIQSYIDAAKESDAQILAGGHC